jgi:hypothetical protein
MIFDNRPTPDRRCWPRGGQLQVMEAELENRRYGDATEIWTASLFLLDMCDSGELDCCSVGCMAVSRYAPADSSGVAAAEEPAPEPEPRILCPRRLDSPQ